MWVGRLVTLGAAAAFLALLFLDWREVVVRGGPVDVVVGSSGWANWGWVGGLCALVLLAKEGRRLVGGLGATVASALRAVALAAGMLAFALLSLVTGSMDVTVAAGVAPDPESVLWPAYAGVSSAVVAAAGALVAAAGTLRGDTSRSARGGRPADERPADAT